MFDLLIKGGVDLNNSPLEIGIKDNKFVEIAQEITGSSKEILELSENSIISAGWIDSHVHCYENMTLYYDNPDDVGVKTGVTTVIDAGSTGEDNIGDFYKLAKTAKTNVFALMNISYQGIIEQDELADLSKIDNTKNKKRLKEYQDFIVGIKARMSKTVVGNNNTRPLEIAKQLQNDMDNLPLMVHIGSAPPKLIDTLGLLDSGDVITHCYNGKANGILNEQGKIHDFVLDAYHKGIYFDTGHGTDSFNFKVAQKAIEEGFICHTISTDIYHKNRINGPVYNMATTLSKMMGLGISLEDCIKKVTKNPADIYNLKNKGTLKVGMDADITIFKIVDEELKVNDSNGNTRKLQSYIQPTHAITKGLINYIKENINGRL